MATPNATPAFPGDPGPAAFTALDNLAKLNIALRKELDALPAPDDLLTAAATADTEALEKQISSLLQRIDDYWGAPSISGETRYEKFLAGLQQALKDELDVRVFDRDVSPDHKNCLPPMHHRSGNPASTEMESYSLHLQLQDDQLGEVFGALVLSHERGHTLLVLPGVGATGFTSLEELRTTVAQWLNDPELKPAVLNSIAQQHQDVLDEIQSDPDMYLEPFTEADLVLMPTTGSAYVHAMDRLLVKQREDIRYTCALPFPARSEDLEKRLREAIRLRGLLGPGAMLARRELVELGQLYYRAMPDWFRSTNDNERAVYAERMQQYDQAREQMIAALNAAATPKQFARAQMSVRIANDLGYDLDPDAITVSTKRVLPVTDEPYTLERTLTEFALYGLHPGDRLPGSAFLTQTTLSLEGKPLEASYASLTPAWLAQVTEELDLRVKFEAFQQAEYRKEQNQEFMYKLARCQINALAYAAKMQRHTGHDHLLDIETALGQASSTDSRLTFRQVEVNGRKMSKLLVVCKESSTGEVQRLSMIAQDAPSSQCVWAFYREIDLRQEVAAWSKSDTLRDYLIQQVEVEEREQMAEHLESLSHKSPSLDSIVLRSLGSMQEGLQAMAEQHARIALSEQQRHTPAWFKSASLEQRQELQALEDAASAAMRNYEARPHTQVQAFSDYVHDRASLQISKLLGVSVGSVDPDHIVITSERETVTYTDLLLNGYDDSLGLVTSTLDTVATFSGPPGIDLRPLSPQKVAASVRGKWLGDDYIALIESTLLDPDSVGYPYRRKTSLLITQLQMQAAALRSLLKGHIAAGQYQWLRDSVDRADQTDAASRKQYPLYPLQIHVDKPFIASGLNGIDQLVIPSKSLTHEETVLGCIVVLPTTIRQGSLLYTPQAPDGIEFRPFSSFTQSLHTSGMIDYYKDRCRVDSRRILSFFLSDMRNGNANKGPVLPREPIADFADSCFNFPLRRKIRDVEDATTSRSEMLTRLIWTSVEIVATVVTLPFPPASFAVGVMLSLHDTVRAIQSLREEENGAAVTYIVSSILNSLGAAGDLHSGLKGFGKLTRDIASLPDRRAASGPLRRSPSLPRYSELFADAPYGKPPLSAEPGVRVAAPPSVPATGTRSTSLAGPYSQFEVKLSLQNVPRVTEGHAKGISTVDGKCYIELSGKTFEVQYDAQMRIWQIIDPHNPFAFYGRQPVRLDDQGVWKTATRPGLLGGGLDSPTSYRPLTEAEAAGESIALSAYELPENMRSHMHTLINKEVFSPIDMEPELFEGIFQPLRRKFTDMRNRLYQDAVKFFDAPVLPPRPSLPVLMADATIETFFERMFSHSNGLVLSEAPRSVASKRLLIQNMPLLARERVEILYVEHLFTDKHLPKLAKYRQLGTRTRSGSHEIKGHLENLNNRALDNQTSEYDYYHLVKVAHRHGIEVRPFSSAISYPHELHPITRAVDDATAGQKMSSFFGHQVISRDVAADPTRRWVALLDEKLATTHKQLPGIAELEGVPGVHIKDVPSGSTPRITAGAPADTATDAAARADFTIEFANPLILPPAPFLPESTSIDTFLIKAMKDSEGQAAEVRWAGEYGFRWSEADGKWSRIEPEHWTPNTPPTAIQQSLTQGRFELPEADRPALHHLANFEHKGLDQRYFLPDPGFEQVRNPFFKVRNQLRKEAQAVLTVELPTRPTLPVVAPRTPAPEFLKKLYEHADAVVVGEVHSAIASKQLIIDNLPLLSQQDVKTLYLEHLLADLHQADLDRFFHTGEMSKNLLHDLKKMDLGHRTDPNGAYTYEQLVRKAQQNGIEVRAIDCTASYHLKGMPGKSPTSRIQMMNYYASLTIGKHQEVMGRHRWIALVGNAHSNYYQDLVPGIAELQGGIGVRVKDVPIGDAAAVRPDPGEVVYTGLTRETMIVRNDYLMEVPVPGASRSTTAPSISTASTESSLPRPGMFMVEETESGVNYIIHRSRDTRIHLTPVLTEADGKLYVYRPSWPLVHLHRFNDMDALLKALEESNLTLVSWRRHMGSL